MIPVAGSEGRRGSLTRGRVRALSMGALRSRRGKVKKPLLTLCEVWLVFILLLAIFADALPIGSPSAVVGDPNLNPSWTAEFLGTDAVGRSMIARLVFGAQVSFEISVLVTLVAMIIGGGVGLVSAYARGAVSFVSNTIANTILSMPGLLLLLTILIIFHPSVPALVGAIAVLYFPGFMRVTRATAISLMEQDYVVAARGFGTRPLRIIVRELLPACAVALVTYSTITLPGAMLTEGALSYLGFGVQLPTPSWGQMIAQGQQSLNTAPWQVIIPCVVFTMTVFSLYSFGDWLRTRLDVRSPE